VRAPEGLGGATPGALCCRSGFPPIPAETGRKYLSRSPLTVLLRQQVEIIRCRDRLCYSQGGERTMTDEGRHSWGRKR